jgi:single-strand DNA-binding protein
MAAHRENLVTLEGNLTRDPELRFTNNGTAVLNTGLAQSTKRGEDEIPQFFNLTVWGDLAENAAASFSKGDRVIVVGRLEYRTWESEGGDKRSAVEVVADGIGPSLRWATAAITKTPKKGGGGGDIPADVYDGDEPF